MIPQDANLGMPGADDPAPSWRYREVRGPRLPLVRAALAAICRQVGGAFAALTATARKP